MITKLKFVPLMTTLVATVGACGGGSPPQIEPIADQIAQVGVELSVQIAATDSDSDELAYDFTAAIPDLGDRASITSTPSGVGVFRWTPQASDVGVWPIDFVVNDGSSSDRVTIQIDVRLAVGGQTAPIFVKPRGTGSTLDSSQRQCVDVEIQIDDSDSATVTLEQEEPLIPGATLTQSDGLNAVWRWCPSTEQLESGEERFRLVLSARDGSNPKTLKNYLVVLRQDSKPGCPGQPPTITHTPTNVDSLVGLGISAEISDDSGLKHEPLLYYSLEPIPGDNPDLGRLTQVSMRLDSGDMVRGTWTGEIPNPVAEGNAGDQATVHYVIVANDDDDQVGDCDHLTQVPDTGTFQMTVTNPGGAGGAAICEACTADIQCGEVADLCVRVGVAAESFCLETCRDDVDCPTDYFCSPSPVESVDGVSARQCVPNSNDCSDPGATICVDDALEDNDSRTAAESNPALAPGSYTLNSCPVAGGGDDEDWFRVEVAGDARLEVNLQGTDASDLDVGLYDSTGTAIRLSLGLTSIETIDECLTAGTYYVRVFTVESTPDENPYSLSVTETPNGCAAPACVDDAAEPDNSPAEAFITDIEPVAQVLEDRAICASNDDWYRVRMFDGETLYVNMEFSHAVGDLDLHFHNSAGTDLTPCCENEGQSSSDNEEASYTISAPGCTFVLCTFYLRVHGYNDAENNYNLRIGLTPPQ